MLQSMRQLAHSWYFKGLMLVLMASFAIWNIGDIFHGNPLKRSVASAGDVNFSAQDLNREFEQELSRARQMYQPGLTTQQAKDMGLGENALNNLIENSLFDQDLKRLGIEAGDRTAFDVLMRDPHFKGKDGTFDKRLLQGFLMQSRVSERAFLDQQRKDIASRQLVGAFTDQPAVPQGLLDLVYKARAQKRVLDVVTFDAQSVAVDAPDDKALHDYYDQNAKAFTAPEMRSFTVAILSTDTLAKDITISDDQVKQEYDTKGEQLKQPEKRDLLQIVLQDEGKAHELAKAAQASGSLVNAAKPTGRQVVPLNQSDEASLLPQLAKPAFALPKGGVSDAIQSPLGWHVIQVRAITPPGIPPYDEIKDKLRETMKNDQAGDTAARLVNQMDDELAAGHTLDDMAGPMKLRLLKVPAVDGDGKMADGKDPAELPHKEDVLKAAFGENAGESSPVMDDKNGTYFVVRTDDITPSAPKSFDAVKDQVLANWKKQEQAKRAQAKADEIVKALREGKAAASFTSEKGVTVRTSKPVSLTGDMDTDLPTGALPQIMRLKKGEATIVPAEGKQVILRLAEIIPAAETKDEAAAGKITSDANGNLPKEFADQYVKYLRVIFPVHIRGDALDSITTGG